MLITTGEGKFYSNGYDIEWITQLNQEQRKAWVDRDTFALVWRMVTFPMPTIAALNGRLFQLVFHTVQCGYNVSISLAFILFYVYRKYYGNPLADFILRSGEFSKKA